MQHPQVEIRPGESIQEADARVESAFGALGGSVLAFENLNSYLPISAFCHFFQVHLDGEEVVAIVMTEPWDEKSLLTVLNILLEIRMDPDPPGHPPLFRFFSAHPVPPVLETLFGDSPISEFECRAALVAHFGKDLLPGRSLQFAAAAAHLLREHLGVDTDFYDRDGDRLLGRTVVERLRGQELPEDGAPLNTLISVGFLYGELLRARYTYSSRWVRLRDAGPWPVLVFGPRRVDGASPSAPVEGEPQVVFDAIGKVVGLYQEGTETALDEASRALVGRFQEMLDSSAESAGGGAR